PPSHTLFPYTTLFRSQAPIRRLLQHFPPTLKRQRSKHRLLLEAIRIPVKHIQPQYRGKRSQTGKQSLRLRRKITMRIVNATDNADRKSTRLNSSHSQI